MSVDLLPPSPFTPLAALVIVVADQFLFLRVYGDDGLARRQGALDGARYAGTARRDRDGRPLPRSCGCPAGCSHLLQQLGDFGVADRVVLGSQFRQRAGALAGPAQGRLRVAARRRLDRCRPRPAARPGSLDVNACRPPPSWRILPVTSGAACNSSTPLVNVTRDRPQAPADPRYAAITQFHGLTGGHQAAGVFIQMRPHASKVLGELGIGIHAQRNNTSGE